MSTDNSEGIIPVDQAKQMTANWQAYLASSNQKFIVQSYLFPLASYQNLLLNNPDVEDVRVYLGLTDANDPTTSQIMLVPIVKGLEKLVQDSGESNVYDGSVPCPPVCPPPGGPPGDSLNG